MHTHNARTVSPSVHLLGSIVTSFCVLFFLFSNGGSAQEDMELRIREEIAAELSDQFVQVCECLRVYVRVCESECMRGYVRVRVCAYECM